MGHGPVHEAFILMVPGSAVQPGGGALERPDCRKMDHETTGPPSQGKRGLDANAGEGELLPARLMAARWHNDGDSSSACLAGISSPMCAVPTVPYS